MNYEEGIKLLETLERLKDKRLLKNNQWEINHIVLLPTVRDTILAYVPALDACGNGEWVANGFNHENVYKRTGLYYRMDGNHYNDELTFYALLKNKENALSVQYKCEMITHLVIQEEIRKEDIPNSVLQYL